MECASCGEHVEPGQRRCTSCFNYITSGGPIGVHEVEVSGRFCSRCGKKNAVRTTECGRCGSGLEAFLQAATIVEDRYIVLPDWPVLRRAGQMAVDMLNEDICMVKVGIMLHCKTEDQRDQTARRLGLARNFDHPNLIPVRDFSSSTRAGYVVFDYVKGLDLESVLVEEGMPWLPESRSIPIVSQMLLALEYLQTRRPMLVLTDIAPDNVLVGEQGRVRLLPLDYREACVETKGRQPYRAAESFWGEPAAAWDVYSVGAVQHHLLTGQSPFSRSAWDYPPVRSYNPMLSEDVERIVAQATASVEARYPMASYYSADLHITHPDRSKETQWDEEKPAIRPGRSRQRTTTELSLTSPGRFSRMTSAEAGTVTTTGGKGLLKGPLPAAAPKTGVFRRLLSGHVEDTSPENGSVVTEGEVEEAAPAAAAPAEVHRPAYARTAPGVHWIYGDYGSILPTIALTERRVLVSTWDGELRGVSPKRGETLWAQKAPAGTWYNLTVFKNGVAGQIWSLPTRPEERPGFLSMQFVNVADGSFLWEHDRQLCPFDGGGVSFAAVSGAHLIVLFVNQEKTLARLLALDDRGALGWSRDFSGPTEWGGLVPGGVLMWNRDEGVLVVQADSGETRWVHRDLYVWRPLQDRAPALAIAQGGDLVVLKSRSTDGLLSLVAVSLSEGEVWWQRCLGPPVGSYYDAPPCIVTTALGGVLCSIPWEYRAKFRHSVIFLDPAYGMPVWSSDVRAPLQELVPYGQDPVFLASTPLKQSHVWGPFSHHRPELPCAYSHLEAARARVGSSALRAMDAATGQAELWRAGKAENESLSFRIRTNGKDIFAAASDGRLHAFTWPDG